MKYVLFLMAFAGLSVSAQVGINTAAPDAQLDIKSSNQAAPSNTDGILIPKIDAFPGTSPTAAQNGMLVFLNITSGANPPGFYYWENATASWKGISGGKGWDVIGNSGTTPATNFFGTTDNADIVFKRFNIRSGLIGNLNTSFGNNSLSATSTGTYNTAFGSAALSSNQTGSKNTAIGASSQYAFNNGTENTSVGFNSAYTITSGNNNTGIGSSALFSNMTGDNNTAIGMDSYKTANSGSGNTAIGKEALMAFTTGNNNTAVGHLAGQYLMSGNNNTAIGYSATLPDPSEDNQLSISNTIYATQTNDVFHAKVGISTGPLEPKAKLEINIYDPANPLNTDGILIPRVQQLVAPASMTANQNGMLVFLTQVFSGNQPGFYYWDSLTTSWKSIGGSGSAGWALTGNSGTTPTANFIGTTDNQDFIFKRNGVRAGIMGTTNVGFGVNALNPLNTGTYNLAFGSNTLSSNTTGQENMAFGDGALYENIAGDGNFAAGSDAMRQNISGSDNVALGKMALRANVNGSDNFALGSNALSANDDGNRNVGVGSGALFANYSGSENIAIGSNALSVNQTGSYNVAIGTILSNSVTGDNNVAIGSQTGLNIHSSNNVVIGYGADVPSAILDNQLSIGNLVYGTDLGLAAGKIGIGETEPEERLHVDTNIKLGKYTWGSILDDKLLKFGDGDFTVMGEAYGDDVMSFSARHFIFNPSYSTGNVGIGTIGTPSEKLEVFGKTKTTDFQMTNGAGLNHVLTSDALGNATWAATTADASFFEVGSSIPPDLNTDAMYHMGNVAIGKNTTAYKLDVVETNGSNLSAALFKHSNPTSTTLATSAINAEISTPAALATGAIVGSSHSVVTANAVSGSGTANFVSGTTTNTAYGTENFVSAAGTGFRYGTSNIMSGTGTGSITGTRNNMVNIGSASSTGVENEFVGINAGTHIGVLNRMGGSGGGVNYGSRTLITTTTDNYLYGNFVDIQATATGSTFPKYGYYVTAAPTSGGITYGIFSNVIKENSFAGYFTGKSYFSHIQGTAAGDGQATVRVERYRDSQNDGTGYARLTSNSALSANNIYGDAYTFAVSGFNSSFSGASRSGGVMGAEEGGTYWGSLGYKSSGGTVYGVYSSTLPSNGAGRYSSTTTHSGIGGGFYGGVLGSWSRGTTMGSIASGSLFAHFNNGDEYTNGHQVELVQTPQGITAAFTVTSTEMIVYKKGKTRLNNGTVRVDFDPAYMRLLKEAPVVTATPMGACNGVYIESIDVAGFVLREQNSGNSTAEISWIAVGDRIDSVDQIPAALLSSQLSENLDKVMFNENNKVNSALEVSASGNDLNFGTRSSNISPDAVLEVTGN